MKCKCYLEFLQYCLNLDFPLPESVKDIDWMDLMAWAEEQAIVGVIYEGIQRAGKTLNIPFNDLMEWVGYAQRIEAQNKSLNRKCVEVVKEYQSAGFGCVVLKGQGNAVMYPNPLLRMSGDIDVWVLPKLIIENGKLKIEDVIRYVREEGNLNDNDNLNLRGAVDGSGECDVCDGVAALNHRALPLEMRNKKARLARPRTFSSTESIIIKLTKKITKIAGNNHNAQL